MNRRGLMVLIALMVLSATAGDVFAHGRRGHSHTQFGFYMGGGGPWWGPGYAPYPYWYEPRTVIIEREPPVYIQRAPDPVPAPAPAAPAQTAAASQTWYYCTDPAGYYPYVENCSQPWVSVDPRTVAPPPTQR